MTIQERIAEMIKEIKPDVTKMAEFAYGSTTFSDAPIDTTEYPFFENLEKTLVREGFLNFPGENRQSMNAHFDLGVCIDVFSEIKDQKYPTAKVMEVFDKFKKLVNGILVISNPDTFDVYTEITELPISTYSDTGQQRVYAVYLV